MTAEAANPRMSVLTLAAHVVVPGHVTGVFNCPQSLTILADGGTGTRF